ncbi:MAG: carboxymuconolactone decarboxylase family protein [Planctomycetota bacterium]
MAFIRIVDESGAPEPLREVYDGLLDPESGRVDEILRIHSLHLEGLKAHVALYRSAMAGTKGLRKVDRELIALRVSQLNRCRY